MILSSMLVFCACLIVSSESQRPRHATLKVGDSAPLFSLRQLGTDKIVDFGKHTGKPKVLVFGSCT